ncbi:hypothetical protein [Nocardia fluminea]|uniref:hypothetical protein n=1 Tax=Nocardia fluminea TaxID=134984 RepID=UPI0036642454
MNTKRGAAVLAAAAAAMVLGAGTAAAGGGFSYDRPHTYFEFKELHDCENDRKANPRPTASQCTWRPNSLYPWTYDYNYG